MQNAKTPLHTHNILNTKYPLVWAVYVLLFVNKGPTCPSLFRVFM